MVKFWILIFATILLLNMVNAEISFFQVKEDRGNNTVRNHIFLQYQKEINNFVSNQPFEFYYNYNQFIKSWNIQNPSARIDYCNLSIFRSSVSQPSLMVYNYNFTENDPEISSGKYFIRLDDGGSSELNFDCSYSYYVNSTPLDTAVEVSVVTPTYECKSCQFYEWAKSEQTIQKTKALNEKQLTTMDYIKKIFMINFSNILALFWIFLIAMVLISIELVFVIIYWAYLYLRSLAR